MPYYRRRSYARRPYTRSRKPYRKGYWKSKQKKYTGAKGIRFFKLRATLQIASDVSGQIIMEVANNPTGYQDWTGISGLFDSFKFCAMKVKYIPQLPNDTSTVTGYFPFYVFADPDSTNIPVTTTNEAIQYENMKVFNMYRPWKYYWKPPRVTGMTTGTILQGGYRDVASPSAYCGIYGIGTGFDPSQQYGQVVIIAYIAARNRR